MKRLLVIILVLIFLTGCTDIPGLKIPKNKQPSLLPTSAAIDTTILNPKDGETVSANYEFDPIIKVDNRGNADSEGIVCIAGLDEDRFRGSTGCECQDFMLYADEDDGEIYEELQFGPYDLRIETPTEEQLTVITRYQYKTTGTGKACIKKDIYSTDGCQLDNPLTGNKKDILMSSTSGSIRINSITEDIRPESEKVVTLVFNIEVEKAREGNTYDAGKAIFPTCRTEEGSHNKIRAKLTGLPTSASCQEGEIDEDGKAIIICEARNIQVIDSQGTTLITEGYEPEIRIELLYGYEKKQTIEFSTTT